MDPTCSKYDVALSYAGEDREYVLRVSALLHERGVRCFYDREDPVRLLGLHLAEELPRIYEQEAAAVVIFISAAYAEKDWTRLERRSALSRAATERRAYVLPARFDDTPLPGFTADLVYVDLGRYEPEDFAENIVIPWLTQLDILEPTTSTDA